MAEPEPTASAPRGTLTLIAIFALGIVFGVALSVAILHHVWRPWRAARPFGDHGSMAIERLTRQLDLDAEQQERVREIVERGHHTLHGFLDETRLEIREVLRPEQRERFDQIRHEGPFGGPPGRRGGPGPPGRPPR
jgi:Spy/CpxP family protein refolding chaperone